MTTMKALAAAGVALWLAAQQVPPPKPEPDVAPGGVFRLPPAHPLPPEAIEPPKVEEPKPELLQYTGKPLRIPFECNEEMIQSFGMTCSEQDPCPVYVELAGLQPLGEKIFVTGNFHNGAATMYSLLLASSDGGKTWREPFERVRFAGLEQIQFYDLEVGWISGHILQALPRDPFFLLTTDGGRIWRRRPVFNEPRISAIDRFWFESRTMGALLIDRVQGAENNARYERFETMTGGDSWMIREVSSRPLTLKGYRSTPENPDWRLRADGALQAHLIERRLGQRWQTVASFQLKPGECKPEPALQLEPPVPPEPLEPPPARVPPVPKRP